MDLLNVITFNRTIVDIIANHISRVWWMLMWEGIFLVHFLAKFSNRVLIVDDASRYFWCHNRSAHSGKRRDLQLTKIFNCCSTTRIFELFTGVACYWRGRLTYYTPKFNKIRPINKNASHSSPLLQAINLTDKIGGKQRPHGVLKQRIQNPNTNKNWPPTAKKKNDAHNN